LDDDAFNARWTRWYTCGLCEQQYHGVVACALGWACWKTYLGRPETDEVRRMAMNELGNGLFIAKNYEDALPVQKAQLSMLRRIGAREESVLVAKTNLAATYGDIGRLEEADREQRDVYSGWLELLGEESRHTMIAANNYAWGLFRLGRFEEAKSVLRKMMPVTQRVLGESHKLTLTIRKLGAMALYSDPDATLDDLRKAMNTLEEIERMARRVMGGAHPLVTEIERNLRASQDALARGLP